MTCTTPPLLEIQNLCLDYKQGKDNIPALNRIHLTLNPGESLGIIGESGCGKTSLAMAIMGLCTNVRVSGSIDFKGVDLTCLKEKDFSPLRWNKIALVFQNSQEVFNPVLTLGEQVAEAICTHLGLARALADKQAAQLFKLVGLDPAWCKAFAHQLSGGMRQRLLMAMAISCKPELLIVDEPFTALDADAKESMMTLLSSLQEHLGFAMILISHSMPAIARLTTRTMTLYAGQVVEEGPTPLLLADPWHPYTRGLINACPEFYGFKDLWGIPGTPSLPGQSPGCPFNPRCVQKGPDCHKTRPMLISAGPDRKVACHKGGVETLLTATGLEKTYVLGTTPIRAVRKVDLRVKTGEVVALVGASGSGKSTLAHLLVRLETPDAGQVIFQGRIVSGREATACIGGIQMVFQDPAQAISPRLRVLSAVCEPLDIMGWKNQKARDLKALAALASVHLPQDPQFLKLACHALSGGQRQRLSVARAMVTDPKLLIADEITAMLDPSAQAVLLRQLKGLQHEKGFSMLFITHDLHLARKLADRAYVLDKGAITVQGAGFEVFGTASQPHVHPAPPSRVRPPPHPPSGAIEPIFIGKEKFA